MYRNNIEEDIDLKNQYKNKNLPDPINIQGACSKNCVDNSFNDLSIIKNTEYIVLNDRNITNARFLQVNQLHQIDSHLIGQLYVDNAIDESSKARNYQDTDFNNYNLKNTNSITLTTQAVHDNQIITMAYVDQFHQGNERSRPDDLGIDFCDESIDLVEINQDNDFNDNKLTNIDSITIKRNPILDEEVSNKKYIDNELDKNTIVRFNQTLQIYLKVSFGNDTYNLIKYDKIQITDTTISKAPNVGGYLIQNWLIKCSDENGNGKIPNVIRATKTISPSSHSGAESLPPISDSFMYKETTSNNHCKKVFFCSWERTDIFQISNITFYYNRFSILTDDNLKSMGRFRIQLFLEDNTWSTQNIIAKNTQYSVSPTDCTLLKLNFTA